MMPSKWNFKAFVSVGFLAVSMPWSLAGQSATVTSAEARSRAQDLLKQMTIEEKVGQMNQSSGIVMPLLASEKPDNLIVQGQVGSILWLIDVKEINRLQHLAVDKSRLHIPILFAFDVIHGYRTVFPIPLAMAASWDPGVEEAAQHLAGEDARAAGIRWTFTPWLISPEIRVGAASWRVRVRIPILVPPWRAHRYADSKANRSAQTACWPASSTSRAMAPPREVATTIRRTFQKSSCRTSISFLSTPLNRPAPAAS